MILTNKYKHFIQYTNINVIYFFTMSLRALKGRGNLMPFRKGLLRPQGARNDKRRNLLRSSR